jgi:alkyl sulfatase BDS1-like metallo-beta-lactamase superfamily hydrolase
MPLSPKVSSAEGTENQVGDNSELELTKLVTAGDNDLAAVGIGDGIFMSRGVSNSYLISTSDGDVLINTGMPHEGERHRSRYAAVSSGPVRVIVFTQSHMDHIGGWPAFSGRDVETVVQSNFDAVREYWTSLGPFYSRRSQRLWGSIASTSTSGQAAEFVEPTPTLRFEDHHAFQVGDLRIELISTPGGETTDSLVVWLPTKRTAFTGNMMGPMFGHVPNLYTIRGDKIRSALTFTESVDAVRSLHPEVLVTGHGDPIVGEELIATHLTKLIDAVLFLREATIAGMNQGKDLFSLMAEIVLPPELALGEGHGKVSWNVRAIWEEYAGWFQYRSTTELYHVPPSAVWAELAEMVGGANVLSDAARRHLVAGRPLNALHLLDIALAASPSDREVLRAKADVVRHLLSASGRANLSETKWLEGEVEAAESAMKDVEAKGEIEE